MFKTRVLPAAGLVLLSMLTVVVTRSVLGADRKPRRPAAPRRQIIIVCSPSLEIDRAIGGAGELEVGATATYSHSLKDSVLSWHLKVSRVVGTGYEVAWQDVYDDRPVFVPRGRTDRPRFSERLIMPAGRYAVEVGLSDVEGDQSRVISSRVAWVTVR
jgi:hypothetical protein